jgi:hypothetical protein
VEECGYLWKTEYLLCVDTTNLGAFDTKQEVRFSHDVLPDLGALGVEVRALRHVEGTEELHVELVLPTHDRALRNQVLELLDAFEVSRAHTVTVSPAILFADDFADA